MTRTRCMIWGLGVTVFTVALDQLCKWWLLEIVRMPGRPPIEVTSFFNLVMVWNRGVSFGMFSSYNQPLILSAISGIIVLVLLRWLYTSDSRMAAISLGLTIGGALGNVIDRLRYGAVADFFDFHLFDVHWPAFNIADSAIFIGVVLLCVHSMFIAPYSPKTDRSS